MNRSMELVKEGIDRISTYTAGGDYMATIMWQGMSRFAFVDYLMKRMGLDCFTTNITVRGERSWIVKLYSILDGHKRLDGLVYLNLNSSSTGDNEDNARIDVSVMKSEVDFDFLIYRAKAFQNQLEAEIDVIKEAASQFERMGE